LAGNLIDAERLMTEAFTAGTQSSQPDAQVFYLAGLTHVRLQQGRLGEFVAELESAAHGQPGIAGYWAATARAMCDGERFREAGAILERASAVGFSNLAEDSLRTPALAMYAEVAVMLNVAEPGRKIYQLLAPWHGRWSYMGVATDGPVDHFLGALAAVFGDFDAADEHLAVAHDMATAAGAAYFAARTELEWGRVLAARRHTGDLDRAGALLRKAWYTSVECGYAMLARRADAELARLNTPGPRSTA
jgi:tetratricopeptide (TPR) repeat protein